MCYDVTMKKNDGLALLFAIVCVASTLRAPITAVGPLISFIRSDLAVSNAVLGLLTTIPLAMFAVFSPLSGSIGVRLGVGRVIGASLLIMIAGTLLRSYGGAVGLFAGTVIVGVGITFGNVLLPSLIKQGLDRRVGLGTSLLTLTLNAFAAVSAGISVPLCQGLSWNWRHVLAIWAVPMALAFLVWQPQCKVTLRAPVADTAEERSVWRMPLAWWLASFMAAQSYVFYFFVAWLPSIVQGNGATPEHAGLFLVVYQLTSILGALVVPNFASRRPNQKRLLLIIALIYTCGITLFLAARSLPVCWIATVICGFSTGACFSMVLLLLSLRARSASRSAKLSGMVQAVGYAVAAISPLLTGWLFDVSQSWQLPLLTALLMCGVLFLSGRRVGADQTV